MVNAQLRAAFAQLPRTSVQNRSSCATDGLEKTSPDGSRRTMGSRVQERRQSRVEQLMRPSSEASGNAATRAGRNSSSSARPRPSASQRGPTHTRTRQGAESGEKARSDIYFAVIAVVLGRVKKRQDSSNLAKFRFCVAICRSANAPLGDALSIWDDHRVICCKRHSRPARKN